MKIPENNIKAIRSYFKNQLIDFYEEAEISSMLFIVLEHYFSITKADVAINTDRRFSESELLKMIHTVKALKKQKPLAYVLGEWEFYGLSFKVNEYTLIPRPETEELVDLIVKENSTAKSIIDIGTGSGCIALALKSELPAATLFAWDISEEALEKVTENATLNQLKIQIEQVDILISKNESLTNKVDVIVSNPPYIAENEKQLMHKNVLEYEPHLALFVADNNPLSFYDAISDFALINMKAKGKLYFEINEHYGNEVKDLLIGKSFKDVTLVKDMNGKDRIVKCCL